MSEVLETLLVLLKGDDTQLQRILRQVERESADTKQKVSRNLDFGQIGANLGGLAGGGGILYALREFAQESAKADAAWRVLKATVGGGSEFGEAQRGISEVANTLKLTESQVVDSFTQMARAGFGIEQITELLISGGASALAFGRDAKAGLEGVSSAAVTGQSIALNAIGIAENIGPALNEARQATAGLSQEQQRAAEVSAFYNLITKATAGEVKVLGTVLDGLPGSQAAVNREFTEFRTSVGAIAQEAIIPLNNALAGTLGFINDLPDGVRRSGTAFVAAGAGATALAAGVGTLALVLGPLVGPAGLFILAAAGIAAVITAANQVPEPIRQARDAVNELADANERLATAANTAAGAQRKNAQDEALVAVEDASAQLEAAEARLAESRDRYGFNDPGANRRLIDQIGDVPQLIADVEKFESALARAKGTYQALLAPLPGPIPSTANDPTNTPTGTGGGSKERTVADVFGDLASEGTLAEQRAAAFGNTLEARLESLETRAGLVNAALNEALDLDASAEQVAFLAQRAGALNGELAALAEKDISVDIKVQVARNIIPDIETQIAEVQDLPTPEISVQMTGEPVDIFGVVFDPATGRTSVGAAPEVRIKASVDIEMPDAYAAVKEAVDLITAPGYEGPRPYAENPGQSVALLPGTKDPITGAPLPGGVTPSVEVNADPFAEAGDMFLEGLEGVFTSFTNALADGRITGDEAAGLGSGLGGAAGGALGFLLGGPAGAYVGSALGGLFGGLLGGAIGGDDSDSKSRAAQDLERRGGASTVTFNLFNSMVNNYNGSPADPGVAAQFDRNLRKSVEEILKQADLSRVTKRASTT